MKRKRHTLSVITLNILLIDLKDKHVKSITCSGGMLRAITGQPFRKRVGCLTTYQHIMKDEQIIDRLLQ